MSFWKELKRRNVYKVGVAYAIVAWLIAQAVSISFPALHLPEWAVTLVIVLLIIGFPLILLFSWAFEITPTGLKWTKEVPHHESITHLTGQKLNYIVTGLLVIVVAFILFDNYYLDRRAVEKEVVSTETAQAPSVVDVVQTKKTIAVLPFVDISPEKDQEYFVDGLSEELLNTLAQIPDLGVTARTSSFTFKNSDKKVQEIASELGVDNVLEGSVRKAGTALRITSQLVRASDGLHLWSKTYDRELKDIFEVQEDIATAVASELKAALGIGKSLKLLGGTNNAEAYEQYLIVKGQMGDIVFDVKSVQETIDEAITLDPEFALAWALKASFHQMKTRGIGGYGPANVAEELDAGLQAALKAIDLEPDLAEAHAVLGGQRAVRGEWFKAESAYRKAIELGNESTLMTGNYTPYLFALGYFKKANIFLEVIRQNDPLRQNIYSMSRNSYICLGDRQHAEEEHKRGVELFGDMFDPQKDLKIRINFGQVSLDEILNVPMVTDEFRQRIKSPEDLLSEMRQSGIVDPDAAAYFGYPELALYAIEQSVSQQAININDVWFPVLHEVRQLPRFKELVREIGPVDYWNKFGWPDICHKLDNGDFECD